MKKRLTLLFIGFIVVCCSVNCFAQHIDHVSTFTNITHKSYFRFHYDNDYFTKTDGYYSQGISFEYVHPVLKKFIASKLLLQYKKESSKHGVVFNLFGYTPTTIKSNDILYGDRPYASCLSIKFFNTVPDSTRQLRLSSAISIGVLGPAALGEEIQTGIHRWLNNRLPLGWQHQVQNDVILNYQVNLEKKLAGNNSNFLLNMANEVRIGTLNNKLSTGLNLMTGHFNDPYKQGYSKKKIQYYFFVQGNVNLIGYDASLQGGMFNKKSPYTIAARNIERLTFKADAGVVFNFKKLYLSYRQSYLTKEFRTGKYHRWGGILIGCSF